MSEEANDLPIDHLRNGSMSDAEAVRVAVDLIRASRVQGHPQDAFNLLADRLDRVKLREEER